MKTPAIFLIVTILSISFYSYSYSYSYSCTAEEAEKEIIIIGTAHVFDIGERIEKEIIELEPEAVAVELDGDRLNSLLSSSGVDSTGINIGEVKEPEVAELNERDMQMLMILSTMQEEMASAFQADSGEDMLAGVKAAIELGVPVYPIDKHITTTMEGMISSSITQLSGIASSSYRELLLMLASILTAVVKMLAGAALSLITSPLLSINFTLSSFAAAMRAALRDFNIIFTLLSLCMTPFTVLLTLTIGSEIGIEGLREVYSFLPELYNSLLADREEYMADRIAEIPESRIVVVTGAAHITGLANELEERLPGAKIEVMTFLDLF